MNKSARTQHPKRGRREAEAPEPEEAPSLEERIAALPEELQGPAVPAPTRPRFQGRVVAVHRGWAEVQLEHETHVRMCVVMGAIWASSGRCSAVAAGDYAIVVPDEDDSSRGVLVELLPRSRYLSRISTRSGDLYEQIIGSHLDQVVLVSSLREPRFNAGLVDRVLAACFHRDLNPVLCVNKVDLMRRERELDVLAPYLDLPGLHLVLTSATTDRGLDELQAVLAGRTSLFAGQSGVGKSCLINRLIPDLEQRVSEVSKASGRGRHTTSASRLADLPGGGHLIDTPGVRAFSPWAIPRAELVRAFPDLNAHADSCAFGDCEHLPDEDGCSLMEALGEDLVDEDRYVSYLRLLQEITELGRE